MTRRAPACARRAAPRAQRAPGADQIIDDQRRRARDVADEEIAGDDAGAAMLVGERLADRPAARASSASRNSSARLAPPVSGETTQSVLVAQALRRSRQTAAPRSALRCGSGRRSRRPPDCAPRASRSRPRRPPRTCRRRSAWSRDRSAWCGGPCARSRGRARRP